MGSVEAYQTRDGRRYRVRYRDLDRRSKERGGFRRKIDAEEYLAGVTVSLSHGDYIDPLDGKVTVLSLAEPWLASRTHLKPSALRPVESAWRNHVEPRWGNRRISDIRHSDVQIWVAQLSTARSATTVLRAHGVLAGILDTAVRDRRIAQNPARGIKLPRKTPKSRHYLSHSQLETLALAAGKHGTLVRFLGYTGLRWGEATGLRMRTVDVTRQRVRVEENAVTVGSKIIVGTPKTHEARSVPFPQFLIPALAEIARTRTGQELVFGSGETHMVQPDRRRGWFVSALRRAQAADPTIPNVTMHDLRHTAASLAVSAGANVKAVQRMLGHASAAMTLDVYADLFDDDLDAVSGRLDEARSRALGLTP